MIGLVTVLFRAVEQFIMPRSVRMLGAFPAVCTVASAWIVEAVNIVKDGAMC